MLKFKHKIIVTAIIIACILLPVSLFTFGQSMTAPPKYAVRMQCEHEWLNGECKICHEKCKHDFDTNGICKICGRQCDHVYENGKCSICGKACEHKFEDGVCTICNWKCPHEFHDNFAICTTCGKQVTHDYKGRICTVCGSMPKHYGSMIAEKWIKPSEYQGECEFNTIQNDTEEHDVMVYTPYGYDRAQKYNLVIALHDVDGTADHWMTTEHVRTDSQWQMKNLYDNMIHENVVSPFIVVSLTYSRSDAEDLDDIIKTSVLPWVSKRYSTYIDNEQYEAMVHARDHICIVGVGEGAEDVQKYLLLNASDISSNFMILSSEYLEEGLGHKIRDKNIPINYIYMSSGTNAGVYEMNETKKDFINNAGFVDEENISGNTLEDVGNDWANWTTSFFNGLQLVF